MAKLVTSTVVTVKIDKGMTPQRHTLYRHYEAKMWQACSFLRVACLFSRVQSSTQSGKNDERRLEDSNNHTTWLFVYLTDNQHF